MPATASTGQIAIATSATLPTVQAPISTVPLTTTSTPTTTSTNTATNTPTTTNTATTTNTPTATVPPTVTSIAGVQRQQLFEEVWRIVNEHYLYPDFRGQDWQGIREEFAPLVQQAESNEAFYALLSEMVGRLGDEHSRFLAPSDASVEDALSTGREAYVGIGVLLVPKVDGALVQEVFPDSPAEQAGLRSRDRIVAIDGAPFGGGSDLYGPEGSEVRLTVVRPGQATSDVVLSRRAVQGRVSPAARRLQGNIGYLQVPTLWVNDMDVQVSGALTDMVSERPLDGLVLDLRGNPGGWNYVLTGILGHFVRGQVGTFFDQQSNKPLMIAENAGPDMRGVALVVLVDEATASYAELLAGVLQAEAGAQVIGVPTAGNTETIYAYELSGGARLWVAQEGFRLLNGRNLEAQGVQPDSSINVDWTLYSEQDDPHILAAIEALRGVQGK